MSRPKTNALTRKQLNEANTMVNLCRRLKSIAQVCALGLAIVTLPALAESPGTRVFGLETLSSPRMATAQIPDGPWFQVEVYIFRQPQTSTGEIWPAKEPVDFSSKNGHFTIDPVPMEGSGSAFQQMPMKDIESYDIGQLLIENRRYQMLYKAAWRQPFVDKNDAPTIFISAGEPQARDRRELEGTLRLHKGRYLHVDAHLVLGKYEENFQAISTGSTEALNASPNSFDPNHSDDSRFDNASDVPSQQEVIALELFELKQSRRIRSGELHYLDHPKFGMLIQINRIEESQG
jgi:hypothetical protein